MTDFARLVLDADTRGLKTAESDLKGVDAQAARTAREVDSASSKMGSAFKKVGVALVAAGIADVVLQFGKASVQAAIDAQEMNSAFDVVFGNMSDSVRMWAEVTGDALGRSTQEIQRSALAFQELFGRALAPAQAVELSKQFAVLTQDLASFKNLSNEVAQQKLFSGLVGEAEPLRAVGVFLDEAALKAKAAALGMGDFSKELTAQEKIVVRAAVIQEQLAQASGDVERTSGSTANQIKTMNAAVEELQVAIGEKLLPVLTPLITLSANLITKLANAAQSFQITTQGVQNYIKGLEVLGGYLARGAAALQSFGNWLGFADERMRAAANRALQLAGPIAQVITLIQRVGVSSQSAGGGSGGPIGVTTNAMLDMARQARSLAGVGGGIGGGGLPAVAEGLDKVGRSAGGAAVKVRAANDEFGDLFESLFPEAITRRQQEQLALIEKYESKLFDVAKARRRALGIDGDAEVSRDLLNEGPLDTSAVSNAAKAIVDDMERVAEKTRKQSITISQSFADMTRNITSSLQGLASSIRSGDFLGILEGVLGIFTQLGSAGVFGGGVQGFLNAPIAGARANGGSVGSGRTYLVGERGPELFTAPGAGRIHSNDNLRGMGGGHITVGIDPRNGNITAFVNGQIAATAPAVANAGAQQAQALAARSGRRRIR